jgi:proteic killer suppression protein
VIKTFKSKALDRFWLRNQPGALAPDHRRKVFRILSALEQAVDASDMDIPGYRLHALSGNLAEFWSVRVNANWRIIYRLELGDVFDVDLVYYH